MTNEWIMALAGGGLIGVSATLLLLFNGRISGISGIFAGVLHPKRNDTLWRALFVIGLLVGGAISFTFLDAPFTNLAKRPVGVVILAGLLVGYGTRLGSGCTSGHGVCGISRMSPRSLAATISFIIAGAITVPVAAKLLGVDY